MRKIEFLFLLLIVAMCGCSGSDTYSIRCEIEGLGTEGVEVYSITPRGLVKSDFHPVDGKLTITGSAADPTLVEVFTVGGRFLFSCLASNGDKINVTLDPKNPMGLSIKGNKASEEYAKFLNDNAKLLTEGDSRKINELVATFVRSNPSSLSSAMLLLNHFDTRSQELLVDSLLQMVGESAPGAHPLIDGFAQLVASQLQAGNGYKYLKRMDFETGRDTIMIYRPEAQSYSLLLFTSTLKGDSIRRALKEMYANLPRKRFRAFEICVDGDSLSWATAIRNDSAKWEQAWTPGGAAAPGVRHLRVASIPYFIVSDSVGDIHYRGTSLKAARDSVERALAGK